MEFFPEDTTCGVEVEPTLSYLKDAYPNRLWRPPQCVMLSYDMVICADVIEHVEDPVGLLESIKSARPKIAVISTPERTLIPGADPLGPPRNIHHRLEWTRDEFAQLLADHFSVIEHYTDPEQYAQVAVVRP